MLTVFFKEQQIASNWRIKQPLDLREIARLRQNPHQLGDDGFGGHCVGLQNAGLSGDTRADLIDSQIAALVRHLAW